MGRYTLTARGERAYIVWYVLSRTGIALILPILIISAFLGHN